MFSRTHLLPWATALTLASCTTPPAKSANNKPSAKPSPSPTAKVEGFQTHTKIEKAVVVLDLKLGDPVGKPGQVSEIMAQLGPRDQTTSVYTLTDTTTKRTVGQAESALSRKYVANGVLRGERRIEASPGGERILIQEEVKDTVPARRYILFQRKADGTYDTWYLGPAVVPIPEEQIVDVNYTLPWIHLTDPGFDAILRFKTPFSRG